MIRGLRPWFLAVLALAAALLPPRPAAAQLACTETKDLRLVFMEPTQSYLAPHAARCFQNALLFHRKLFDYTPAQKVNVFLSDFSDFGNAGAGSVPRDILTVSIAPLSFAYETFTANERMNYLMNHELAHVVTMDQAAGRDLFFRGLFRGKPAPTADHPESVLYFYLTAPRVASPRWYLEGLAVFLDTWMAGGLGRAQGPFDEMVFRSMVKDGSRFYDPLGLSSELTKTDFQLEANSYLYGGRFMNYLAYTYGPETLVRWTSRHRGSKAYYAAAFRQAYGMSIDKAWQDWIAFERAFQEKALATIRQYPVTPFHDLSPHPLGSVSRAFYDPVARKVYAGMNSPGRLGHVGAIAMEGGAITKIRDIKNPRMYTVTSLAWDQESRRLFYTADQNAYRDLMELDPATGKQRMLLKDARIGELVLDRADRSLWGVRTLNGICTLVRIAFPYQDWHQVRSWPYGEIVYDLDLSADGKQLAASVGEINGTQSLRVLSTEALLKGETTDVARFDFGTAIPSNFVFTDDGRFLYGSSYYTGVSNIFRYELATGALEAVSNSDTGFFRPIPIGGDELIVFRFTGAGFVPARITATVLKDVAPIAFLGHEVVEKHPVLKTWMAGSPGAIPIESMITSHGRYRPIHRLGLESIYPVVEGYKDTAAVGVHVRFTDPIQFNAATLTATVTPGQGLPGGERVHLLGDYRRYGWHGFAQWNRADFYDLFGPTKTSLKGYAVGIEHLKTLVYDRPRQMELVASATFYGGLERLPDFQNVTTPFERLLETRVRLSYRNVRSSLGSVDDEKGYRWDVVAEDEHVNGRSFPKVHGNLDAGVPLSLKHSSVWLRTSAGVSPGDPDEPFANFFFGGFGNNWVDHREEKRYREHYAFPGVELDEIGGRNYGKAMLEWNAPPLRFRRAGRPGFYASWARPAVFASTIVTNVSDSERRRHLSNVGAQVDVHFAVLSGLDLTLSAGWAAAFEKGRPTDHETMVSLKLLR